MCSTSLAHSQPEQCLTIQRRCLRLPGIPVGIDITGGVGCPAERRVLPRFAHRGPALSTPTLCRFCRCPALLHSLPGATRNTTEPEPEKCDLNSDPSELPWPCSVALELGAPTLCALRGSTGTDGETLFPGDCAKQELIPVYLKWEKLKRARCQRHFSNFLESTGLLESSNCRYLKNIKREFIIAQAKNSLILIV